MHEGLNVTRFSTNTLHILYYTCKICHVDHTHVCYNINICPYKILRENGLGGHHRLTPIYFQHAWAKNDHAQYCHWCELWGYFM
jgi:hypothetical protein